MGHPIRGQVGQPAQQDLVEGLLAHPDRWVAENPVDDEIVRDVVGAHDMNPVGGADQFCVLHGESPCPLVHIYRPDLGVRCSPGGDAGDRAPATADIENDSIVSGQRWCFEQQKIGADIEFVGREDTAIRAEHDREVGQTDLDGYG